MPWQQIEASVSHLFMRKARASVAMPDLDLFGEAPVVTGRVSNAGRPRVPLRVMIALLYLKHAFNESDEGVVDRWAETPTWQFLSGQAHFEHRRPCDATTLVKFRKLLGDEGVEELLAQTINTAVEMKLIAKSELSRVIVDSTVQQKAIAHPTDSRLLEVAREKLVQAAKDAGIALKQTFVKEGQQLSRKARRYAQGHWPPAHGAGPSGARSRTQARHLSDESSFADHPGASPAHLCADRRQEESEPSRQRQALRFPCAGGGVHWQGQEQATL
jgi:IS5 family transposase